MSFVVNEGRLGTVKIDATALWSSLAVFTAQIAPSRYPRDVLRDIHEDARSRAGGASRPFLDAHGRPTAKLRLSGTDLNDSLTFEQQGVFGSEAVDQTLTLVARNW